MDKITMAHEWAMKHGKSDTIGDRTNMIRYAWDYADAMQAEAEKREDRTRPAVLNMADSPQLDWQPDWSQAPDWADFWAMDKNLEARWILSDGGDPYIGMCNKKWFSMGKFNSNLAPSFNYQGDWKNSLRKRPE